MEIRVYLLCFVGINVETVIGTDHSFERWLMKSQNYEMVILLVGLAQKREMK